MNDSHDGGLLGRITALALILGVAYGVRAIARGGSECPFGVCLLAGAHHEEPASVVPAPAAPAAPKK